MRQPRIFAHYLQHWFLMDVVTSLPLATLDAFGGDFAFLRPLRLIKVFKLARLAKVTRVSDVTRVLVDMGYLNQAVVSLVSLLAMFYVVIHWIACLYWLVSRKTEADWADPETKLRDFAPPDDLLDKPLKVRLTFAYHWAVYATYAGLPAKTNQTVYTPQQSTFLMFCAMVGMWFIAVLIGEVATVLDDIRIKDKDKQAMLQSIDDFMSHHKIAYDIRARIRSHFIFIHNRKLTRKFDSIFEVLPKDLKARLSVGVRVPYLRRCPCFDELRPTCVSAVAEAMATRCYAPMEIVANQADEADGIYCIADGAVFHFMRSLPWPKVLASTRHNDTFGEECVLALKGRMFVYGTMSHNHSEIYVLPSFEVLVLGHQYPSFNPAVNASAERKLAHLQMTMTHVVLRPSLSAFVADFRKRHPNLRHGLAASRFLGSARGAAHFITQKANSAGKELSLRVAPIVEEVRHHTASLHTPGRHPPGRSSPPPGGKLPPLEDAKYEGS